MSDRPYYNDNQILMVADRLAKLLRYKDEHRQFYSIEDLIVKANRSLLITCSWCCEIWFSDYFDLPKIASENEKLLKAIQQYKKATASNLTSIPQHLIEAESYLTLMEQHKNATNLKQKATGRHKNYRARYMAGVIGNCYFDHFKKWPRKTPSGAPPRYYYSCVDDVCEILDPLKERAASAGCKDFLKKPWRMWKDIEIPIIPNM